MTWKTSDRSYDFVKEWKAYAEESGRDLFFRFFCYYLAFNHLYDSESLWNSEDYDWLYTQSTWGYSYEKRRMDELDKIISLLRHLLSGPSPLLSFSVSYEEWSLLKTVKRKNPRSGLWYEDAPLSPRANDSRERAPSTLWLRGQKGRQSDHLWRDIMAMAKIYRIRCNLFHGEKHPTDDRDIQLVETSNVVLGRFLDACAQKNLGYAETIIRSHRSNII